MSDLKLIDELLCDMKQWRVLSWKELESYTCTTAEAMQRLRQAWKDGTMKLITLSLARYFGNTL